MVNPSSDLMISRSLSCPAFLLSSWASSSVGFVSTPVVSTSSPASAVVPLFPAIGWSGAGGVAVDKEEEDASKDVVVVPVGEELGNAVEGNDPANGLENDP